MAASTPRSSGTDGGTVPSSSRRPPRATIVADGSRPTNENRLQRSPCSTDSSRNPARSPTQRAKAATGVMRSEMTSSHTGTTVWSAASLRNSSLLGLSTGLGLGVDLGPLERAVEARVVAGVAGAPALLVDDEQQGVTVAVVVRLAHPLPVARGVALAPLLLAAAAPEDRAPLLQRALEGDLVHPGHHQHLPGRLLLDDGGHQPVVVV